MSEPPVPAPPAWVRKRDGRLAPFEADKISRALFAATEAPGRLAGLAVDAGPIVPPGLAAEAVARARDLAADFIALDGLALVPGRDGGGEGLQGFGRELAAALELADLRAVVNLNTAEPPPR